MLEKTYKEVFAIAHTQIQIDLFERNCIGHRVNRIRAMDNVCGRRDITIYLLPDWWEGFRDLGMDFLNYTKSHNIKTVEVSEAQNLGLQPFNYEEA